MKESPRKQYATGYFENLLRESLRLYREPIIFILIAAWSFRRQFREALPKIIPTFLVSLASIELVGPSLHFLVLINYVHLSLNDFLHTILRSIGFGSETFNVFSSFALFLSAVVMATSYHRQQREASRQSALLSSIGAFIEERDAEDFRSIERLEIQAQVQRVLSLIVTSLRYDRERVQLTAVLLIRGSRGYQVYSAVPETYSTSLLFDPDSSLMAEVNSEREGEVLYLPYIAFGHGLKISSDGEARFVPGIIPVEIALDLPSRSMLAAKIHIPIESSTGEENTDNAVLVLTASRQDFMRTLDFNAVRIAAALIANILRPSVDIDRHLWKSIWVKNKAYG
jgi:positive regulator of sigma E activity